MMKSSVIALVSALAFSASAMAQTPEYQPGAAGGTQSPEPAGSIPSAIDSVAPTDRNKGEDIATQPDAEAVAAPGTLAASTPHATPPANICVELVTFLMPKPAPAETAGQAGSPPANTQQAAAGQPAAAGQAAPQQPSGQSAQAQKDGGSAQQASAQSGVAAEAPKSDAPAAVGSGQNAPQTSGQSAPIPQTADKNEPAPSVSLEEAQGLAAANDIAGCRASAQKMRREGVEMPNPLIALAALDMRFLERAAPAAEPAPATPAQ